MTEQYDFQPTAESLLAAGYQPQPPRGGLVDGAEIDRGVCEKCTCEKCGHKGLEYRPFSKPGSSRAFAVCSECGYSVEF